VIRERVAAEQVALGGAAAGPPPAAPRSRGRRALRVLVPALILAAVIAGAVYGIRQVYFLGSDSAGRVALYRGLPYDLPLGIKLYSEVYAAPVQVNSLPAARRQSAIDHTLRGHNDAVSLIDDLVKSANPPQPKPRQPKPHRTKSAPRHRSQRSGGNGSQSGGGK
jgi:predicted secreted protein